MRIGFFKRLGSYIIDMSPIFAIMILLHSWFIGGLLQNIVSDDYEAVDAAYLQVVEERNIELQVYVDQLEDGTITDEEYSEYYEDIQTSFFEDNEDIISTVTQYWAYSLLYFVFGINLVYLIYMLIVKGQSFGRRLFKIELYGNVVWYTLVLRELMWKNLMYTFPIILGLAINPFIAMFIFIIFLSVDAGMIMFTKKKRTLRDIMSQTYLGYAGVNYPF